MGMETWNTPVCKLYVREQVFQQAKPLLKTHLLDPINCQIILATWLLLGPRLCINEADPVSQEIPCSRAAGRSSYTPIRFLKRGTSSQLAPKIGFGRLTRDLLYLFRLKLYS